jgi:hypothetical protein
MELSITKLNFQDNLEVTRGLIHFRSPMCKVVIKGGTIDNDAIKLVTYLHNFEDFSLPEKQGNNLVYHCWNNEQVDNIIRYLTLLSK